MIKTKTGTYKKRSGKGWNYYKIVKCSGCKKETYQEVGAFNKGKPSFCSDNYNVCYAKYRLKEKDPTLYNIMKKLDDPNFYYLIGWICTDGHILYPGAYKSSNGSRMTLMLGESDYPHLIKMQKYFGGKIGNKRKTDNCYSWILRNKEFVDYLRDTVGLTHNKTYTLDVSDWFNKLNDTFKAYFMRGVIDGDGSIGKTTINIVSGSRSFIDLVENYFDKGKVVMYNNTYTWRVTKKVETIHVLNNLYDSVNSNALYLDRKYNKAKLLMENA